MATAKLTKSERSELDKLLSDFDQARVALADRLEEIVNEWTDAISDRESDAFTEAQSRIDTLQSIWDELPKTPVIDFDELM